MGGFNQPNWELQRIDWREKLRRGILGKSPLNCPKIRSHTFHVAKIRWTASNAVSFSVKPAETKTLGSIVQCQGGHVEASAMKTAKINADTHTHTAKLLLGYAAASTWIYIYIYIVHISTYVCIYIYIYIYVCINIYLYSICTYKCIYFI